jgi:FOG: FHA domain
MSATGNTPRSLAIPPLSVRTEDGRTFRFTRPFNIGREHDCEVRIEDGLVSRKHVIVSFGNGRWRIRDQRSGNGVFVDGHRVESASIDSALTIQLGTDGPLVTMELAPQGLPTPPPRRRSPPGRRGLSRATRRNISARRRTRRPSAAGR